MQDSTTEIILKVIEYINDAFDNRPHGSSFWLDENGNRTVADVGYAEEWWNDCMKPELRRYFSLNG